MHSLAPIAHRGLWAFAWLIMDEWVESVPGPGGAIFDAILVPKKEQSQTARFSFRLKI